MGHQFSFEMGRRTTTKQEKQEKEKSETIMLKLIFLVTLLNFVIAEAREEDGRYPRKSMEHEFEMESEVPEGKEVSERLFFQNKCKKENEKCGSSLTGQTGRCCNKDQECKVCKPGNTWCKLNGTLCVQCFLGTGLIRTCQPKA